MPETRVQVVIVHNHWIHYKDLLFRAMLRLPVRFTVLFTASGSAERLPPSSLILPYPHTIGYQGAYENVPWHRAIAHVWRNLSRLQAQCVIISGWYDWAAWTAWLWCVLHRKPMILWAESNKFDRRRKPWLEIVKRVFVSRIHLAHVYGTSSKLYLMELGLPEGRILVKRAVVDTWSYHPVPEQRNKASYKILLFVGRLVQVKNLPCLLRAFAAVRQDPGRPRLVLRLVGYGPLEDKLRKLAKKLKVEAIVEFAGPASQAELPAVYSGADLFVLASTSETWGLVVSEAMCCGLPVIVSERCGCAADLVNAATGWTFNPYRQQELTGILERAAGLSRDELGRMGAAGRELALTYSPEQCADIVVRSIHQVVRRALGVESNDPVSV